MERSINRRPNDVEIDNDCGVNNAADADKTRRERENKKGEVEISPALQARHENPLGLQDSPSPIAPRPWRWVGLCTFVLLATAMLAAVLVITSGRDKKASLLHAEERRLQESVHGRLNMLQTWLDGQLSASRRLTESQVFRLFIADLALQRPGLPLPRSLQDQRPYFRQLMTDFVNQHGMLRATVMRQDGSILLSSPGPALAIDDLLTSVDKAPAGWKAQPSPIRNIGRTGATFATDILLPLAAVQTEGDAAATTSTFLVLTISAGDILEELLSNAVDGPTDETIVLFQKRDSVTERLWLSPDGLEHNVAPFPKKLRPGERTPFGRLPTEPPVYALAEPLPDTPWTLYHELDAKKALIPVSDFIMVATGISVIIVLALTVGFSALWWRKARDHYRELVGLYRSHTKNLEQQRQFFQAITTSIGDWLTVNASDGRIIYANPAFMAACGQPERSVLGKTWSELVVSPTTTMLEHDELSTLLGADPFAGVAVGDEHHFISSSVSDLKDKSGSIEGTVRVVRNHTEAVVERQRRMRATTQTIDAFVHAVELRDPFLVGHTQRLRSHAIAIGRKLDLADDDLAGLALAASLSQIGKIFIPDAILTKPDRHSEAEADVMRGHVLHAVGILERIDFDLPIVKIVSEMYERLDGSGYPHGRTGGEISRSARILGAVDVFCARTAPRSYRDRMSFGKALYHLASNGHRYDLVIVAALADVIGHPQDNVGCDGIERTFIDAAIWQERCCDTAPVEAAAS